MKKVLFVCVENAGRSQIAEGFFKKLAPSEYDGISAGTIPISEINPLVVQAMKEVGLATLLLNLSTMVLGYITAKFFGITGKSQISITIDQHILISIRFKKKR